MSAVDTILVVADEEASKRLLEVTLKSAPYDVVCTTSEASALEAALERPVDLVVFDMARATPDAWAVCSAMSAHPTLERVPVVVLTAKSDQETHELAIASGADDFLAKPVTSTELLLRVRSLLRVRRMTRELEAASTLLRAQHQSLVSSQQSRDDLATLVVHDLKSPLTCIVANTQFALDDAACPPELREALDDVVAAAQSMHRMVLNLLDISRSENGMLTPRQAPFNLAQLLEDICRGMQRRAKEGQKELVLCAGEGAREVLADKDIVRRMIENLVDNAIQYGPPNTTVRMTVGFHDAWISMSVEDEGTGVPLAMRERVFDKFVQIAAPEAPPSSSRGLGLAFCKLAAHAHGGRIWFEDRFPRGAAFCVQLPG